MALSIVSFWPFNIGSNYYHAVVLSDGSMIRVSLNPIPGTGAVLAVIMAVAGVTLANAGTGYAINDTVTLAGGVFNTAAVITVDTVAGGVITNFHLTTPGTYTTLPTSPASQQSTSGSGTGASFTLTSFAVASLTIINPGLGYSLPIVTIQGGGSGATATLTTTTGGSIATVAVITHGSYTGIPTAVVTDQQPTPDTNLQIAPPGTFTTPSTSQWGAQYLLIVEPGIAGATVNTPGTAGLWAWDNSVLYGPGTLAVSSISITNGGTGYTSVPAVTVSGGTGFGATFVATIESGSIQTISITNSGSGYVAADPQSLTLAFAGGGGSGAAATVKLMPIGIVGASDIVTYQNRVWITANTQGTGQVPPSANIFFSSANELWNFDTATGGGVIQNSESTLKAQYTALLTANGSLYPFGDSSIDVINNVATDATTGVTLFANQNVDPQNGTSWHDTTVNYGRAILFANPSGVYGLYGGTATKISQPLDDIFHDLSLAQNPSAGLAVVHGIKCYFINLLAKDYLGVSRTMLFGYNGKHWFVASQNNDHILQINTLIVNSEEQLWATDGQSIFQCFTTPDPHLTKIYQSKLWAGPSFVVTKECTRAAVQIQTNVIASNQFFNLQLDSETGSLPLLTWPAQDPLVFDNDGLIQFTTTPGAAPPTAINFVPQNQIKFFDVQFSGKLIGTTFTTTYPDATVVKTSLGYIPTTAW